MQKQQQHKPADPSLAFEYAREAPQILSVVYDCLELLTDADGDALRNPRLFEALHQKCESLNKIPSARHIPQSNGHITEGLRNKPETSFEKLPRVARLCVAAWVQSGQLRRGDGQGLFLPSPLRILRDILTIPGNLGTRAYAHAVTRRMLFSSFNVFYPSGVTSSELSFLDIEKVIEGIGSIRTYALHRDNIHYSDSLSIEDRFLRHFLALTGSLRLRFRDSSNSKKSGLSKRANIKRWLKSRVYLKSFGLQSEKGGNYEFRLSNGLLDIPETQQILNEILGVPIAIPGAETVFFGGLRRSDSGSAVISISGQPGTGKTSISLALASALAPFGTRCLYCSFEEGPSRLKSRIGSLRPASFRLTSLLPNEVCDWFIPVKLDPSALPSSEDFINDYILPLNERLKSSRVHNIVTGVLPSVAPVMVVIDALGGLGGDSMADGKFFQRLVQALRELRCLVVLLSPEGITGHGALDYAVDTVIRLRYTNTESADKKPLRILQLDKTRLQLSRPGSHILHLTGDEGVRIAPQLPSQLDSRKTRLTPLPSESRRFLTFSPDAKTADHQNENVLIRVQEGSRILIHGRGSTGKAGLALKILTSPVVSKGDVDPREFKPWMPRILALSFLYPEEYYNGLHRRLSRLEKRRGSSFVASGLDTLHFTPGFLGPEDFIQLVASKLEQAELEGRPYERVLLDGLHNVFLQFPSLEAAGVVWPTLYDILNRQELTVVTTFTTFVSPNSSPNSDPSSRGLSFHEESDSEFVLRGHRPLLHALVQCADYFLEVDRHEAIRDKRAYSVRVISALNQSVPRRHIVWNADSLVFESFEE